MGICVDQCGVQSNLPASGVNAATNVFVSYSDRFAAIARRLLPILGRTCEQHTWSGTVSARWSHFRPGPVMAAAILSIMLASCTRADEATNQQKSPGQLLYEKSGCAGCHGRDGTGIVGPALTNILGSEISLEGGRTIVADYDYLVRSILDPGSEKVDGFSIEMPSNTLTEKEAQAIATFLQELK